MRKKFKLWMTVVFAIILSIIVVPMYSAKANTLSIKLNKKSVTLKIGETYQLKSNFSESVSCTWKSSNKSIVTVSATGKLRAKKAGSATVTANINGKTAKCKVTVAKAPAWSRKTWKNKVSDWTMEFSSQYTTVFKSNGTVCQIGWRNKKTYIDAFLNTTAAFWYPDTEEEYLDFVCFNIQKDDPNYPHVEMRPVSQAFYRYYTAIGSEAAFRKIPVIRQLFSMGLYFWLMVAAALYVIYRKEYMRLLWMLPFWTYMGTSLLGPAALIRYSYPVMLGAPILLYFCVKRKKTGA